MNLVSNFDYIRIISVSLIWIIEDDRLDREWELWSSNESIHNTIVHLSLILFNEINLFKIYFQIFIHFRSVSTHVVSHGHRFHVEMYHDHVLQN